MDMPLPVTGGVMVKASPMQHSFFAAARCGFNCSPATEQNESGSNSAAPSRSRSSEPVSPRSQSDFDSGRRAPSRTPKKSAHVHLAAVDAIDADVAVRRKVHFQIRFEIHLAGARHMRLDAKPARIFFRRLGAPSGGTHDTFAGIHAEVQRVFASNSPPSC